jgi:hypothetical protein
MASGAQAVKNLRRSSEKTAEASAKITAPDDKSFFELLAVGPLALIFQFTWPTMRTVWRLRLVCREWTQVIDEQLRRSNNRYYVSLCPIESPHTTKPTTASDYSTSFDYHPSYDMHLFAQDGWMVDERTPLELNTPRFRHVRVFIQESFPSGSNQKFLYSLISQLATLPYLEEIHIGGYEQGNRNGNDLQVGIELDEAVDLEVHLEILRAFFAQLKKVHTFRGTLGLDDVETILLAAAIKDMPALRHVDFAPSGSFCKSVFKPSEAIKSLSELRLSILKGIEHDEYLWAHFDPAEQVNLRTFSVGFTVMDALEGKEDLPDAVADLVSLIDNVRRMPRLEELTLRFFEMAPIDVRFWRALRPQLESLVAKVEPRRLHPDSLLLDLHHEALIRWALGVLAPGLRRVEFEYM